MAFLHRHRTPILLMALLVMTSYNAFVYFFTAYPFNIPRNYAVDPIPTRRHLARKVLKIQREIEAKSGSNVGVDAAWAKGLLAVVAELDPRVTSTQEGNQPYRSHLRKEVHSSHKTLLNVCPEVYKGREFDLEFENNFEVLPCRAKRFSDVLTILIPAVGLESQRIEALVKSIKKLYDINIVVLAFRESLQPFKVDGAKVKFFDAKLTESQALNLVIHTISTPYTFIAYNLADFNEHASLERLVRVLEEDDKLNIASGAYRDVNGHWNHGCLQTSVENYELTYFRGYEHSHNECMFCDDVLGPFVARTNFLKTVSFTETMDGVPMYRDWFLNVRLTRSLVMSCPDVMFFVENEPSMNKDDWYKVANKWSIEHIKAYDGETFEFSCEDAQISCINMMKAVSSFLVPPCCRKQIRKELTYVEECAKEIGVHYELQAGSLLGAVKMDGMLPWDFDTDIISDCNDKDKWMSEGYKCLSKYGCTLKVVYGNYWVSSCELSTVDINCRDNRTANVAPEFRSTPTLIEFSGRFTRVPGNPGRVTRNYYGPEYLKHAVHWRYSSNSIIPFDDGSGQNPGLWSSCVVPAFHSCIDHFPADGNMKFKNSQCRFP